MPGSVTSVFSEADDFEAALHEEGCLGLLVTGRGAFRARLTQIALHRLRLSVAEEHLSRIAQVLVPAGMILVSLSIGSGPMPVWGGVRMRAGEIMTLGAGQPVHVRTDGPCRWAWIWLPAAEFQEYGSSMTGETFCILQATRWWQLRPATIRHLRHLHSAAIGLVEGRSKTPIGAQAAHGLEQQLIEALVEGLSKGRAIEAIPATAENQDIAARFETLLQTELERALRMAEICSTLGVSAQTLRLSCEEQLGIGPTEYIRRRRMQLVHRRLRHENNDATTVSAVARRYGFRAPGRFAANYRAIYGELPSATLRRGSGQGLVRLPLRRARAPV
jgi:AraC family ethanolamine operon transcriptional activator